VQSAELDAAVAKNTKELADATTKRKDEKEKYDLDMGDMTEGVKQMGAAIQMLTQGTAFLQADVVTGLLGKLQKFDSASSQSAIAMLQTKTKTSGQIIGILNNMKTTFESDMGTMTAKENEAKAYFLDYKDRTDRQIKADKELSAAHKKTIANNSGVISTTSTLKKTEEKNLKDMEKQLKDQTEQLQDHTRFHTATSAAAAAQIDSIQSAVKLLSSPEAMKTMAKSEEHMTFPEDFLQVASAPAKAALLSMALSKKAAGEYGWSAIYTAIDDMVSSLNDELEEAEQQFVDCEAALQMHSVNEDKLKKEKVKRLGEIADLEETIDDANKLIEDSNDTISKKTKEINDLTQEIREIRADTERETAEAAAAHSLFQKAVEFLKSYDSTVVEGPEVGAGAAYNTAAIEAGNTKVIKIVEEVDTEMMDNIKKMQDQAATDIETNQGTIGEAKDSIASAEDDLAKAQTDLADATRDLNSQNRYMAKVKEGLAAEESWWGPAPGNKLPAPGEFCAEFTGRHDLYGEGAARVTEEGTYEKTAAEEGTGEYHKKKKAAQDEIKSLNDMKKTIKDLEKSYVVPQATEGF